MGNETVAKFVNTTARASRHYRPTTPQAEQANYYDVGVQQKITRQFTVGLDTYYKQSHNLIDEGQFGAPDHFDAVQLHVWQTVRRRVHRQLRAGRVSTPI